MRPGRAYVEVRLLLIDGGSYHVREILVNLPCSSLLTGDRVWARPQASSKFRTFESRVLRQDLLMPSGWLKNIEQTCPLSMRIETTCFACERGEHSRTGDIKRTLVRSLIASPKFASQFASVNISHQGTQVVRTNGTRHVCRRGHRG